MMKEQAVGLMGLLKSDYFRIEIRGSKRKRAFCNIFRELPQTCSNIWGGYILFEGTHFEIVQQFYIVNYT